MKMNDRIVEQRDVDTEAILRELRREFRRPYRLPLTAKLSGPGFGTVSDFPADIGEKVVDILTIFIRAAMEEIISTLRFDDPNFYTILLQIQVWPQWRIGLQPFSERLETAKDLLLSVVIHRKAHMCEPSGH
jgi:hypothetical protein